jgi:hypothetical protein
MVADLISHPICPFSYEHTHTAYPLHDNQPASVDNNFLYRMGRFETAKVEISAGDMRYPGICDQFDFFQKTLYKNPETTNAGGCDGCSGKE